MSALDDLVFGWKKRVEDWKERIEDMKYQNNLMEKKVLTFYEKRIFEDGKLIERDVTATTIAQNRQWIADLEALIKAYDKGVEVSASW